MRTRPLGSESVSRYTSCVPSVRLFGDQLNTMLLPVAVADNAMLPLLTTELELEDGTAELDDLLEVVATELDDLPVDVATELDDFEVATELDDGATELELVPPHTDEFSTAPFLPTPATVASLSFTHCGDTGE